MKRLTHWLCFAIGLSLCGCGGAPQDQLVGTWVIDPEAMEEMDDFKSAPESQRQMMESMMSNMKMEVTFTRDRVKMEMDMMGMKNSDEKDYTVKSSDGQRLVLSAKDENGKDEDVTVEITGDKLILQDEGKNFTLRRK